MSGISGQSIQKLQVQRKVTVYIFFYSYNSVLFLIVKTTTTKTVVTVLSLCPLSVTSIVCTMFEALAVLYNSFLMYMYDAEICLVLT